MSRATKYVQTKKNSNFLEDPPGMVNFAELFRKIQITRVQKNKLAILYGIEKDRSVDEYLILKLSCQILDFGFFCLFLPIIARIVKTSF